MENQNQRKPLAELLRPGSLEDLVGVNLKGVNLNAPQSMILWGPPGCGKTSFAKIVSKSCGFETVMMSAVTSGSAQFKSIFDLAERGQKILLHVDEIHHLNKSQQDIFLPHLENGNIVLLGTTTENPSFELRPALLSRCKVIVFKRLTNEDLELILKRAEKFLMKSLPVDDDARKALCEMADGDGRYLLNMVEEIMAHPRENPLTAKELPDILAKRTVLYDKHDDEHYNLISALHKSLRGSDVDAALYWFSRMLEGGENPLYIARRLVRFAVEDVGMADPNALTQAIAAQQAYSFLGSPEGELAICQAVIYLATAPKSNAGYVAYNSARKLAKQTGSLMPPKHILNAPTKLMKELGYFEGYIDDPDTKDGFSGQNYFPEGIERRVRQRGSSGSYVYYETTKRPVTDLKRVEIERSLSQTEYLDLLMEADPSCRPIRKTRYCLTYENQYFEIDLYPFWDDKAIVEIELQSETTPVLFPKELEVIREVTDDPAFKNAALARI